MGKPACAVLTQPVNSTPNFSYVQAVGRDANHESPITTRRNLSPAGRLFSPKPIATTIRKVVATVAGYSSANLARIILVLPSCSSKYIMTPDVPSATHLSSQPRGTGLRGTNERCGMPSGGPDAPVHCIMDSSGVTIQPHLNCAFSRGRDRVKFRVGVRVG